MTTSTVFGLILLQFPLNNKIIYYSSNWYLPIIRTLSKQLSFSIFELDQNFSLSSLLISSFGCIFCSQFSWSFFSSTTNSEDIWFSWFSTGWIVTIFSTSSSLILTEVDCFWGEWGFFNSLIIFLCSSFFFSSSLIFILTTFPPLLTMVNFFDLCLFGLFFPFFVFFLFIVILFYLP